MQDIFDIQDEISLAIVAALKVKLLGAEKATVLKRYTDNNEVYQLYLKGRFFWNKRTDETLKQAIGCFQQAIDLDPNYALAWAGWQIHGFTWAMPSGIWLRWKRCQRLKRLRCERWSWMMRWQRPTFRWD